MVAVLLLSAGAIALAQSDMPPPAVAHGRVATTRLTVTPDHEDWTYRIGEPVRFLVRATWDGHALPDVPVRYSVGPERMPVEEQSAIVPAAGLSIAGGTLDQPGFVRCIVTAEVDSTTYRAVATVGFAPDKIAPTQAEPADFDTFWAAGKAALTRLPLEAEINPVPSASNAKVEVFRISLQNVGAGAAPSRIYGTLCVPRGPGPFPAVLHVPGAGIRPYHGTPAQAELGIITLDIGIHGIPVDLPPETYLSLERASLAGYTSIGLDDRDRYYYRRVYLGCVRANDFLVTLPKWDGRNLFVSGGSQGGQLSIVTAALDPRVTAIAVRFPAYCDVTGYLHGRAGGWPHMFQATSDGTPAFHGIPSKIVTTGYYDVVNFARRVKVPGIYSWGYNDEVCPPTSMFAAYNVIPAPKELLLALESGHKDIPEQVGRMAKWLSAQAAIAVPVPAGR